mmetsp:Transcript_8587/g.28104  ORF Transcript_8587/g.28104 Transcript_8587/m.28104 type:complete len:86 (-) Transcript_8587:132-389(-)
MGCSGHVVAPRFLKIWGREPNGLITQLSMEEAGGPLGEKWTYSSAPMLNRYMAERDLGFRDGLLAKEQHEDPAIVDKVVRWYMSH